MGYFAGFGDVLQGVSLPLRRCQLKRPLRWQLRFLYDGDVRVGVVVVAAAGDGDDVRQPEQHPQQERHPWLERPLRDGDDVLAGEGYFALGVGYEDDRPKLIHQRLLKLLRRHRRDGEQEGVVLGRLGWILGKLSATTAWG